jgi:hypothetical protein
MDATFELGSQMNIENVRKTNYMLMSPHQNARHKHNITTANRCFENVANLEYVSTTVTNQYLIHEEIKNRLYLDNAWHQSFQNLLSFRLLYKNIKINICETTILSVV